MVCLRHCRFQMEQDDFSSAADTFLEDDLEDKILAQALEESLRHYREVEVPLRQSQQKSLPAAAGSSSTSNKDEEVPESVLYTDSDVEGFDLCAGRNWIYPINYPIRNYQFNIVQTALYNNTLVSLPTGLGKTFIAAVVMYNFYRWFPCGKVIFMAPTKPLVNQQIDSCYNVMGIPKEDTAELTGTMSPTERAKTWKEKRVFFATPQVVTNDLTCGICPAAKLKCVVVDEAHKATGNYSYCQVIRALLPFNKKFRILALSATPGSDEHAVIQVIKNLLISKVEIRSEESADVVQFTHKRNIEKIVVPLGEYLSSVKKRFMLILDQYVRHLQQNKGLYGSTTGLSKFKMLKLREMYRQNPPSHLTYIQKGLIEADFAVCVSLLHSLELLSEHGLRSCLKFIKGVVDAERGQAVVQRRLAQNEELKSLLQEIEGKLGPDVCMEPEPDISLAVVNDGSNQKQYVCSHPKLEKLREVVVSHFRIFQEKNVVTRAMIFCQYRDTVIELCHILQEFRPLVKPMTFVGQSTVGKQSKGFTQKQQLKVMQKFRSGGYNTLISTCVGEEGLDIGDVDLIVCFDAHKSPIRLVQRMGRTGRKREGRIIMLLTEGNEHNKYKTSMYQSNTVHKKLLEKKWLDPHLYAHSPRMVPSSLHPVCFKMFIAVPTTSEASSSKQRRKGRNQDIRKLFSGVADRKNDMYCTQENCNAESVLGFNRLPVSEELHAKTKGEIFKEAEVVPTKMVNFGEWLDCQRTLQDTVQLPHSDDTKDLVQLLQYAEEKRTTLQPTQGRALLSQVNCSLMWPVKKKGKRKPYSKQRSKTSAATENPKSMNLQEKDQSMPTECCHPSNGQKTEILINGKTLNKLKAKVMLPEPEVIEIIDDSEEEQMKVDDANTAELMKLLRAMSDEILGNNANKTQNGCFLSEIAFCNCKNNTKTEEVDRKENPIKKYQPINPAILQSLTKGDFEAVNVVDLVTPPNSPTVAKPEKINNENDSDNLCREVDSHADKHLLNTNGCTHKKPQFNLKLSFMLSSDDKNSPELNENAVPDIQGFEDATCFNFGVQTPHKNDETFLDFQSKSKNKLSKPVELVTSFNTDNIPDIQEFENVSDFSLDILSHKNDEAFSGAQNVSKNEFAKPEHIKKLFSCPKVTTSEKVDYTLHLNKNITTSEQQNLGNATPQKLKSILHSERKRPDISPFKYKVSCSQQQNQAIDNASPFKENVNEELPLSPILCTSQKTQCNDYKAFILPKGSSTPKIHKKNLFSNTKLEETRNKDLFTGESKHKNIQIQRPRLNFDLMTSFRKICGSFQEEENELKQNQISSNPHSITMYTVTQLAHMVDASSSVASNKELISEQELGHSKQNLQVLQVSSSRKLLENSFLFDSEDDIFAELDLQGDTNNKSTFSERKDMVNESVKHNIRHCLDNAVINSNIETNSNKNKKLDSSNPKQNTPEFLPNKTNKIQTSSSLEKKQLKGNPFDFSINNFDTPIHDPSNVVKLPKTSISFSEERLHPHNHKLHDAEEESPCINRQGTKRKLALNFSTSSESFTEHKKEIDTNTIVSETNNSSEKIILDSSWLNSKTGSPLKKKVKRPRKETQKIFQKNPPKIDMKVLELSSDDSDFESQCTTKKKQLSSGITEANASTNTTENNSPIKKKRRLAKKTSAKSLDQKCQYVENEAEVSGVINISSDDEDTSGLDEYDSSFVSDTSHMNDADGDDMQVKYLHSIIRSPGKCQQGRFKIPATSGKVPFEEIFSQVEEMETSYQEDSFCVEDGEEEEPECNEVSCLDLAEAVLEAEEARANWKKRRRKHSNSGSSVEECVVPPVKRKRIILMEDSDSEEENNKSSSAIPAAKAEEESSTPLSVIPPNKTDTEKEDLTHFFEDTDFPELDSVFVSLKEQPHNLGKNTTNERNHNIMDSGVGSAFINSVINDKFSVSNVKKNFSDKVISERSNSCATSPVLQKNHEDANSAENGEPGSPVFVCSGKPKRLGNKVVRSLSLEYNKSGMSSIKVPERSQSHASSPYERGTNAPALKNRAAFEVVLGPSTSSQKDNHVRVIMSTRQIASAPEIATALRAQYEVTLLVKSIAEADYIVSWRAGVLRITISEFMRGNFNKSNESEELYILRSEFMQPYLIIENDKSKPLSATTGNNSEMWNEKTAVRVMNVSNAGIVVMFSSNKADTAQLIAKLANSESKNNRTIIELPNGSPILEARLQYYHSLPGVNLALALKLCMSFSNIMDFLRRCVTVNKIQEVTGLSREKAARIYLVLHHGVDENET